MRRAAPDHGSGQVLLHGGGGGCEGGPPGVQGRQFFPSTDRSQAVCLWEADSIEALQGYLDSATEGVAENASFEVDTARHGAARGSGSRRIGSDLEPL